MQPSSRTLLGITCAGAALAICAWILIRPGSRLPATPAGANSPDSGPSPTEALHAQPAPGTDRERESASLPATPADDAVTESPPRILGLVLDDATGAAIDRFEIQHFPAGAGRTLVDTILGYESPEAARSTAFEGGNGRFDLADIGPEVQSLAAVADGYERSDPVTVSPGRDGEALVIRLRRAAVVRGIVVDPATGVPVQGALVGWIDYAGRTRTGPSERFERTDALGRFVLGSVPLSARRILAGREDLGEGLSERLQLGPGEHGREIAIELRRPGS